MPEYLNASEDYRNVDFIRKLVNDAENDSKKRDHNRKWMIKGDEYYAGTQSILFKKRLAIGEKGIPIELPNLPNNVIVDNEYERLVMQKSNYIVGKEPTFLSDDKTYNQLLEETFDEYFDRTLLYTAVDSLNGGIGWIMPYYNDNLELRFRKFKPVEIIPVWADEAHTELEFAVRRYAVTVYEKGIEKSQKMVDVFHPFGRLSYKVNGNDYELIADEGYVNHFNENGEIDEMLNWGGKIPLVPFKYNSKEIPLIKKVITLQDTLNLLLSDMADRMQEDTHNTILVIVNYDGQNLGEFRQNLAQYGAVKVKDTGQGGGGDVRTLQVEVNIANFDTAIAMIKRSIIVNGKGYDTKDLNAGTPNQMNIKSMYTDIDLDTNTMETEYQASMKELLYFVDLHLLNMGFGDFRDMPVSVTFNRDMIVNESEVMTTLVSAGMRMSQRSLLKQSPFVDNVDKELELVADEQQQQIEMYDPYGGGSSFNFSATGGVDGDEFEITESVEE